MIGLLCLYNIDKDWSYGIWLVDLVFLWYSKAVVFVKHDGPDIYFLLTVCFGESTR
jgi:hypothetical protein